LLISGTDYIEKGALLALEVKPFSEDLGSLKETFNIIFSSNNGPSILKLFGPL